MQIPLRIAAFVAFVTLLGSAGLAAEHTKESLAAVKKNVDSGNAVLVDVREKREWDAGHIHGAVFVPLSSLDEGIDPAQLAKRLPKGKIVYTHCVVGKRAVTAGNILEDMGYEVRCLKPGYAELLEAGFKKAK
jgi:rhodanese-related sulfurtransferase